VAPRPFAAGGVYVRVRGVDAKPKNVATTPVSHGSQPGHYVADVKVPAGGIAAIAIGLEGFRITPGHAPARADVFFAIVNDPFAAANTPVTATSTDRGATTPWALFATAIAVLGVLLVGYRVVATRQRPVAVVDRPWSTPHQRSRAR
jgi:hypothetical protein